MWAARKRFLPKGGYPLDMGMKGWESISEAPVHDRLAPALGSEQMGDNAGSPSARPSNRDQTLSGADGQDQSIVSGNPARLQALPLELIDDIASGLDLPSATSLALTCRRLHHLLAHPHIFRLRELQRPDRTDEDVLDFLRRLDRDSPDHTLCHGCIKLHDPLRSLLRPTAEKARLYACLTFCMPTLFNSRLSYNVLEAIMRRRRRGQDFDDLLRQTLVTTTAYRDGVLLQTSHRAVVGDSFLFRTQHVLAVAGTSPRDLFHLWAATMGQSWQRRICGHVTMREMLFNFWGEFTNKACLTDHSRELAIQHQPECLRYAPGACQEVHPTTPIHRAQCYSDAPIPEASPSTGPSLRCAMSHSQPCGDCDLLVKFGAVRECEHCYTEYSIAPIHLPSFGLAFVLTSWKDLGDGTGLEEPRWKSHRITASYGCRREDLGREGSIFHRFEGGDDSRRRAYAPHIGARNLARIMRWTTPEERHSSGSSTLTPDPDTGRIANPDPLEED